MTVARQFFSETVQIASDTPISVQGLLQAAGWGFEPGANNSITTTPSMDTFEGAQCFLVPLAETLYVGHDQYVRQFSGSLPVGRVYKGAAIEQGSSDNVVQHMRGIIDAAQVWVYSVNAQEAILVFVGI